MEGYEAVLRFTDMMTGDWAWIPVSVATLITAAIYDFFQKMKGGN